MTTFGDWIRNTREAKGWSAVYCAKRAGMLEPVWSNWENGRSRRRDEKPSQPRPDTIRKIAKGLGVTEEEAFRAAYMPNDEEVHKEESTGHRESADYVTKTDLALMESRLVAEIRHLFESIAPASESLRLKQNEPDAKTPSKSKTPPSYSPTENRPRTREGEPISIDAAKGHP